VTLYASSQRVVLLRQPGLLTATISAGTALSSAVDLGGAVMLALVIPSGWTAAGLTFQASVDGVTYGDVFDDANTEVTVPSAAVVAGRVIVPAGELENLAPLRWIKLRSGPSSLPVNQASTVAIQIITKG
jgi:hypothetical protein